MVMCFVCNHYSERKTCKFYRFPKNPVEREEWIKSLGRKDRAPSSWSLVCSCHFNIIGDKRILKNLQKGMPVEMTRQIDTEVNQLHCVKVEESLPSTSKQIFPISTLPSQFVSESSSSASSCKRFEFLSLNEADNYFLKQDVKILKKQFQSRLSFQQIADDDSLIMCYTGIPNKYLFDTLFELLENIDINYYNGWTVGSIPKKDQLLLALMKLRLNLLYKDLAFRFNISVATVSNIFITWIHVLHETLFLKFMAKIPLRDKNRSCLPVSFSTFTNCRIILDCTEIATIKPQSMDKQKKMYSYYKHHNTLKALVGVAPNGVITFVSELYPGGLSDKKIVSHSNVLSQMVAGDLILADKGFLIQDLLPQGVHLNIPPFLSTSQFTPMQVVQTKTIASARIHVERAIRRIKCFRILTGLSHKLLPQATVIFQVIAALTNMQFPLVKIADDE